MSKRALVTGSARRLGRAMAIELAGRGYDVAIHYAGSADAAGQTAADLRDMGVSAAAVQADLQDDAAVASLIGTAADALGGPLSVLVNNASAFDHDDIQTLSLASWDRSMASNLKAPVFLTQAFAAQAPKGRTTDDGEPLPSGLVVNMIDQRVRKLTPEFMTYSLAKMGLWAFTRTAAQALAPDIRVNGIGPGPTMQGGRQTREHFDAQRHATLLGRGSSPEGICRALGFFLEAEDVTGHLFCGDGGQHLSWQTPDVRGVE